MIGKPRRRKSSMDDRTIPLPRVRQEEPTRVGYHAPPWKPLSDQALSDLYYGMQRAMVMANRASEDWHERSNYVNALCDSRGYGMYQRAEYRSKDIQLTDAFGKWSFFEREVRRYSDVIASEFRMRQMMGSTLEVVNEGA